MENNQLQSFLEVMPVLKDILQAIAQGQQFAFKEVTDALEEIVMSAQSLHNLTKMI
jgi:hypothetical protein